MHEPKQGVMQTGLVGGIVVEDTIADKVRPGVLSWGIETLDDYHGLQRIDGMLGQAVSLRVVGRGHAVHNVVLGTKSPEKLTRLLGAVVRN